MFPIKWVGLVGDVEKEVTKCIWLNLRYGIEELVLQKWSWKWVHSANSAKFGKVLSLLVTIDRGQWVHLLEIHVFLGWLLKILWSQVANNWVVSEICDFWGEEMLEIHTFLWIFGWVLCLESWTATEVQNFIPFCYWKGVKFVENIHEKMQNWMILRCITDTILRCVTDTPEI